MIKRIINIYFFDTRRTIMDMKNLAAFVQVAELHSFTKAAAKLGFSQSTISFQIRQLEAELDTRLFDRINHTVVLTEKGKEVLGYAYQILQLTQKMTANMLSRHLVENYRCRHRRNVPPPQSERNGPGPDSGQPYL